MSLFLFDALLQILNPSATTAEVPAGTVGTPTAVIVTLFDTDGLQLPSLIGNVVAASVSGGTTGSLTLIDTMDGRAILYYIPLVAGTDFIAITLNGSAIPGSPFNSLVASNVVDPIIYMAVPRYRRMPMILARWRVD